MFDLLTYGTSGDELPDIPCHSWPEESSCDSPVSSFESSMRGTSSGSVDFLHDFEPHGGRNAEPILPRVVIEEYEAVGTAPVIFEYERRFDREGFRDALEVWVPFVSLKNGLNLLRVRMEVSFHFSRGAVHKGFQCT